MIFDTFTIGTPDNLVTFNDFEGSPIYRCTRRAPTRREIEEFDIPLPESSGVADYQTFIGKTYFIVEGIMYPDDETEFWNGRAALRKLASVQVAQGDSDSDFGYVPLKYTENVAKQQFVKVLYVDMQETTRQGQVQPFRLLCKMKYPVIFSQDIVTGIMAVSPLAGGGGGVLPIVLPSVLGADSGSGTVTVVNAGDIETYPSFLITGTVNRPKITNVSTGKYIEVDVNLGSSDTLIINYDQDSSPLLLSGGTSVYSKLTSGSTLFTIKPGSTVLTLTGTSVGSDSSAVVSFLSAWPLS